MSGRKASEVNSLLRNGEQTRSTSIRILDDSCKKAKISTSSAKRKREECEKILEKMDFSITDSAKKEFPEVAEQLEKRVNSLMKEKLSQLLEFDETEYRSIKDGYEETDREADCVRKDLQNRINSQGRLDPWYCDAEYARAAQVQNKYRDLAKRVSELNRNCSKIESLWNSDASLSESRIKQADELKKEIEDLEKKANSIKEMRKKATCARENVKKIFGEISEQIAVKFMKKEYEELKENLGKFTKLGDEELLEKCTRQVTMITSFKNSLDVVYSEYMRKKKEIEGRFNILNERINNPCFSNPEDEFTAGEKGMNSLLQFLEKYDKEDYSNQILREIDATKKLISNEKFDEAMKKIETVESIVEDGREHAERIHENKMKTIFNMLSIEKVMRELNYDVMVTENPDGEDGYCIECNAGNECITFDKVTVVEDGKPVITINHKEDTKGTCHAAWHEIRQKLSTEGLFIQDITKDGHSIHNPNSGKKNQRVEAKGRKNLQQ